MKKNISMNDFGIKKLGRSIIDANVSQGTVQASGQYFQRVLSLGLGIDDRGATGASNAMERWKIITDYCPRSTRHFSRSLC
jgi:hypothetical protein